MKRQVRNQQAAQSAEQGLSNMDEFYFALPAARSHLNPQDNEARWMMAEGHRTRVGNIRPGDSLIVCSSPPAVIGTFEFAVPGYRGAINMANATFFCDPYCFSSPLELLLLNSGRNWHTARRYLTEPYSYAGKVDRCIKAFPQCSHCKNSAVCLTGGLPFAAVLSVKPFEETQRDADIYIGTRLTRWDAKIVATLGTMYDTPRDKSLLSAMVIGPGYTVSAQLEPDSWRGRSKLGITITRVT